MPCAPCMFQVAGFMSRSWPSAVVQVIVLSIGVTHQLLGVFRYVEEGDGWCQNETTVPAEPMYPTVSRAGVHVATLENRVAIVACVVGAGDRSV